MSVKEDDLDLNNENIRVVGNEICYFGDVDRTNCLEFVEKFKKLEIELLKRKAELIGYQPEIRINIMSDGGDIFSGINMMNILENSRVKVITIAQGSCCSAATFILLGGSERRIGKNAYILIHQISTEIWGKYREIRHELKSTSQFMKMLKKMYLSKTKIPAKVFRRLMRKDIYLSPKRCKKYNIVDLIE